MKHPTDVEGALSQLAEQIGDLRYDALAHFLRLLSAKLDKDARADAGRGRAQLAQALSDAAACIDRAWKISEPYMKEQ